MVKEDVEVIRGTGDQRGTSISNNLAAVVADSWDFLVVDQDLLGFDSPVVFIDNLEIVDGSSEQVVINTTKDKLGVLGTFNGVEVETENIVVQSLLLHNIVEQGVHVVGSHFRVCKTNNTIESRLKERGEY